MKYYIARQSENIETGDAVVYRIVKRLRDFKAEDGVLYRVFKSKDEMRNAPYVPLYIGVGDKLRKHDSSFVLRF